MTEIEGGLRESPEKYPSSDKFFVAVVGVGIAVPAVMFTEFGEDLDAYDRLGQDRQGALDQEHEKFDLLVAMNKAGVNHDDPGYHDILKDYYAAQDDVRTYTQQRDDLDLWSAGNIVTGVVVVSGAILFAAALRALIRRRENRKLSPKALVEKATPKVATPEDSTGGNTGKLTR